MKPKIFPKCTTTKAHTIMTSLNKHCTRFPPNSLSHTLSSLIEIFVSNSFLNISNSLSLSFSLSLSMTVFIFSDTISNSKPKIWYLSIFYKFFPYFVREKFPFFSLLGTKFFLWIYCESWELFTLWVLNFKRVFFFFFWLIFFFFGVFIRRLKKMIRSRWWSKKTVSDFQFGCTENGCFGFDFAVTFLGLD